MLKVSVNAFFTIGASCCASGTPHCMSLLDHQHAGQVAGGPSGLVLPAPHTVVCNVQAGSVCSVVTRLCCVLFKRGTFQPTALVTGPLVLYYMELLLVS